MDITTNWTINDVLPMLLICIGLVIVILWLLRGKKDDTKL